MSKAEKSIIEIFKTLQLYPASGYGSLIINIQSDKIVNIEKKESIKLSE